jgi:hypothetical protein
LNTFKAKYSDAPNKLRCSNCNPPPKTPFLKTTELQPFFLKNGRFKTPVFTGDTGKKEIKKGVEIDPLS